MATVYAFASPSVSPFVIGSGVETVVNVEGATKISADFGASPVLLTFNTVLRNPTWNNVSFNGLLFGGAGVGQIVSATVLSSTMAGFNNSRLHLSGGQPGFNWSGLPCVDGTMIEVGFTLLREPVREPIPEPATWAMLIAGFGLVGTAVRRRRAAPA